MTNSEKLDHLADLAGIEPWYWDIWGQRHHASVTAKRGLLAALGHKVETEDDIERCIEAIADGPWQRRLPPVAVVRHGAPTDVVITTSPRDPVESLPATLTTEDGTTHALTVAVRELPLIASSKIGDATLERRRLTLPDGLPLGYHTLEMTPADDKTGVPARMMIIVVPAACWLPDGTDREAAGEHASGRWGVQVHLYAVRSPRNWGIGDFTDLAKLSESAARLGAAVVGVNPLHALFPSEPERASPYSPSSRLFLNPLYIDPEALPEFAASLAAKRQMAELKDELDAARAARFIEYPAVSRIKHAVLKALFAELGHGSGLTPERAAAFTAFKQTHGDRLHSYAVYSALANKFDGAPWLEWPAGYETPNSQAVATFVAANQPEIEYHAWLQWIADEQYAAAAERGQAAGLGIGIYADLAVGVDPGGADAWCDQASYVNGTRVGCPPDPFAMLGQDWGTPPLSPTALAEQAYEPFIAMLRANMSHAGALRIDHAMGLMRLYWIPPDLPAADGAYLNYPFEDLLGIVALESHRQRCLVVGEDLGTVPGGFRERMAEANILSYRVLYFEKDGDRFKRPDEYPPLALACVTTHDLATLAGFWSGEDIRLRKRLELYPSSAVEQNEWEARTVDRRRMLEAMTDEGLLSAKQAQDVNANGTLTPELVAAVHGYLARSPAQLVMVQLDDMTGEMEQLNVPSTIDEYPNWRRKLSLDIEQAVQTPAMAAVQKAFAARTGPRS